MSSIGQVLILTRDPAVWPTASANQHHAQAVRESGLSNKTQVINLDAQHVPARTLGPIEGPGPVVHVA